MAKNKNLEQRVAELIESLPPMPANVERLLLAAARHAGPEVEQQLVHDDPGLCFELLHLANSSCSDGCKLVETIPDAVDRVSLELLAQVIGAKYTRQIIEKHFAPMADLEAYFDHSQDISTGCHILAQTTGVDTHQREMLAVAGLIHDIGRLVIMLSANRLSAPLMGTSWDKMATITDDERNLLGMNHCDVGAELCRKWNFSPTLQEGVLRHHTPLRGEDFSFPGAMIFVAHFVTVSDFTGQTLVAMLPPELMDNLGVTPELFEQAQVSCRSRRGEP
jgi:HD-like signal output (HDOD) protein